MDLSSCARRILRGLETSVALFVGSPHPQQGNPYFVAMLLCGRPVNAADGDAGEAKGARHPRWAFAQNETVNPGPYEPLGLVCCCSPARFRVQAALPSAAHTTCSLSAQGCTVGTRCSPLQQPQTALPSLGSVMGLGKSLNQTANRTVRN